MTGLTNYTSDNLLNYLTGQIPEASLPSVYMALFTAVGTDAGTGFTEVSGGGYVRVQVAGALTLGGAFTTSSTTLTLASTAPAWLLALGTNGSSATVYDVTAGGAVGTVSSVSGTTVTLTSTASRNSSGSSDSLTFSAFPNATGTAPSSLTNNSAVSFGTTSASWGTVLAWGFYDASSSGNLLTWDFLGGYNWLPFEVASGSNPTFSVKANGYSSNDPIVFTAEYGGTLPSASTGTFTGYTVNYVATPATDAINVDTTSGPATPVVLTSSGSGQVRKILQQGILSAGIAVSFAASTIVVSGA